MLVILLSGRDLIKGGIMFKCKRCKRKIPYKFGICSECREIEFQETLDKQIKRKQAKYRRTKEYGRSLVRKFADGRFWSSSHAGCFRATIPKDHHKKVCESEKHIRAKFDRWLHHMKLGRIVYCELRLKEGFGRPDLIVVDNGFVFCEEIAVSENEASLRAKKKKYPFPTNIVRC